MKWRHGTDADSVQLIAEIEEAFADAAYPGDDGIVERLDWEGMDYREDLRGKNWRDIIEPKFLWSHSTFAFFSPEGFRFYLPAYLIGLITFPHDSDLGLSLLEALYTDTDWSTQWLGRWDRRMRALSPVEKHAVRSTLEFLLHREPGSYEMKEPPGNRIALALANYWQQF